MILALLLTGVLAISIGAMLGSVQYLNRSVRDKLAMEDAYQAAMAGLHMGRAWLGNPSLAGSMLRNPTADTSVQLTQVLNGAMAMSADVITEGVRNGNTAPAMLSPAQIVSTYFPTAEGTSLADGRRVIFTFPSSDGRVLSFLTNTEDGPNTSLTDVPSTGPVGSFVSRLRITTPYEANTSGTYPAGSPWNSQPWEGAQEGLRRVSLILEAEGTAISGARPVTRVVQQKLLVFPNIPEGEDPLPSSGTKFGQAIVAGANVAVQGSSSLNIYWGTVLADGDIELLTIDPINTSKRELSAGNKFYGAGVTDYWVRYQASGQLYKKQGSNRHPLFPAINGVQVTDFFSQAYNGDFGEDWRVTPGDPNDKYLTLKGYMESIPEQLRIANYRDWEDLENPNPAEPPALYTLQNGQAVMGEGALVQNWPQVREKVNHVLNVQMDYDYWKAQAMANGIYMRPKSSGSGFVNEAGAELWVTPDGDVTSNPPPGSQKLTNLRQITMKSLIPASGETEDIADRILFIDTPEGTRNGTLKDYDLNSSSDFFWKGMMYVNGNVATSGGGAFPRVIGRDPNQWNAYMAEKLYGVPNNLGSTMIENCFVRGVIYVSGTYSRTGNAAVYGTIIARGGYAGSGAPDVYYDERNGKMGLFAEPVQPNPGGPPTTFQITGGPLTELGGWPS